MERWATFDCYGTLVDWNAGIAAALGDATLLERYHELEPEVQAEDPERSYREVLRETARRAGRRRRPGDIAAPVARLPRGARRRSRRRAHGAGSWRFSRTPIAT